MHLGEGYGSFLCLCPCATEFFANKRNPSIIDNLARTYVNGNQDKQAKVLPFRFSRELNDLLSTNLTRSQFFGADHGRNKWAKHSHKVQTGFRIQYSWYEVQHRHSTARFESLMSSDEIPHAGWHAGLLYDDPDRRRYGQVTFTVSHDNLIRSENKHDTL